jgi:hypothetical protein
MTTATALSQQAAYERLLTHGSTCSTCRTLNKTGGNANLPCVAGAQIFQEYRQTLRGPAAPSQNGA